MLNMQLENGIRKIFSVGTKLYTTMSHDYDLSLFELNLFL